MRTNTTGIHVPSHSVIHRLLTSLPKMQLKKTNFSPPIKKIIEGREKCTTIFHDYEYATIENTTLLWNRTPWTYWFDLLIFNFFLFCSFCNMLQAVMSTKRKSLTGTRQIKKPKRLKRTPLMRTSGRGEKKPSFRQSLPWPTLVDNVEFRIGENLRKLKKGQNLIEIFSKCIEQQRSEWNASGVLPHVGNTWLDRGM